MQVTFSSSVCCLYHVAAAGHVILSFIIINIFIWIRPQDP